MDFKYTGQPLSREQKEQIISERNSLHVKLVEALPDFFNQVHRINRSNRFWEIIMFRFIYKFAEDVISIECINGQTLKPSQYKDESIVVPISNHEYSNLRHTNDQFYQQYFEETNLERGFLVEGKLNLSRKRKIKNFLFKLKLNMPTSKKRMLLFSEYYPKYWEVFYPEYKIVKVGLRAFLPQEVSTDVETRRSLKNFLQQRGFSPLVVNALPFCFPVELLEAFMPNYELARVYAKKIKVDWMVAGWFPELWTSLICAEYAEKGVSLSIVQHGGSYGESKYSFGDLIEQRICDQFLSWSQKEYDEKRVPVIPTRLVAFREKYEKLRKEHESSDRKRYEVLVVDGFHYRTITISEMVGWAGSKANIINFIKGYGKGDGEGILLRLYHGKYAENLEFEKELRSQFEKLTIHNEKTTPLELNLMDAETIYVNYKFSTLRWEANYIGKKVFSLPGLDENAL